ncbi:glycosyltransferase [Fulvivirgaceae bacterium BMA10]|uniref:Glycosyltransferase n=1 Tax=Splendidivirga corallicola TaxID=3051826 RepID=A0ABT8KY13_9BACT|nr:glycosyltransferase [Fulvivirgaceae bacterium BMA10]
MQLRDKNILLISPEKWSDIRLSKHHYALTLSSRGNKVYFLNPPDNIKFKIELENKNLFIVDAYPLFKGLRKLPRFLSAFLTTIEFRILERKMRVRFDVIWNFENSRFFNLSQIRQSILKISHIVDLNQNFQFKLASQTCDIAFGVANSIVERHKVFNKHSFKISHGLAEGAFEEKEVKVDKANGISAAYIGNLSIKYLDWDLLKEIIEQNVNVHFYFIGPLGKSNLSGTDNIPSLVEELMNHDRAHFMGKVPSNKIVSYLKNFDVMLLAYQVDKYPTQLENSHKLMEYMATGKVTVATYTDEYKDKGGLLEMVEDKKNFSKAFHHVVNNLQHYNSIEKQDQRINFAKYNSYSRQLDRIENLIKQYIGK